MTPTAAALRAEIDSADIGIKKALRAGDMDMAWTLVSRKIGLRIVAGDIVVKLKKHRL
jgi:ATP/maltotriose-dependent transcriptional regulator MalT